MSVSNTATSSTGMYGRAFWERFWRTSGIQAVGLFIIAYAVYSYQPQAGRIGAFLHDDRLRILIATMVSGLAVLNLLWFAAAIKVTLADAGQDGWGAAATAASAAVGVLLFVLIVIGAAPAYSTAGTGDNSLGPSLGGIFWAFVVVSSFPRAMLIMAGTLGLWRAGLISNALFGFGVVALILVLVGGATWLSDGLWAPDGVYARFVSPVICLVWVVIASKVLLSRSPATRAGW